MKRVFGFVLAALFIAVGAYARGNKEHIEGTVTQLTDNAITVQLKNKTTKTLTVAEHTNFEWEESGQRATLKDLRVGDRVVIEVEKGKLEAHEVNFGPPTANKAPAEHVHIG